MTSIAVNKWKAVTDARHSHYRCNCNLVRVIHDKIIREGFYKLQYGNLAMSILSPNINSYTIEKLSMAEYRNILKHY